MDGHDIVVIGASAGGVEALMGLVRRLPPDLPAALFVVLHIPPDSTSALPRILTHAGHLPARHAEDGERIIPGRIYVAPPDRHLLIERGRVRVTRGPRENRHRPAVDPLFRSAALAYGPRVMSVILSGSLDDGTAGSIAVKSRGGISVVQEPGEALYAGMPNSAIANDQPDYVLALSEMSALIVRLAGEVTPEEGNGPVAESMERETSIAAFDLGEIESAPAAGTPSPFGCPECGGVLWEIQDGTLTRYRCRVGHAYSADSLLADQSAHLEAALWAALRGLEEKAALSKRLHDRAHARGHDKIARRFAAQSTQSYKHAAVVRRLLLNGQHGPPASEAETSDRELEAAPTA